MMLWLEERKNETIPCALRSILYIHTHVDSLKQNMIYLLSIKNAKSDDIKWEILIRFYLSLMRHEVDVNWVLIDRVYRLMYFNLGGAAVEKFFSSFFAGNLNLKNLYYRLYILKVTLLPSFA